MRLLRLLLLPLLLASGPVVWAQEPPPLDSATLAAKSDAGVYLVHWAAEDGSRSEQAVFMKNFVKQAFSYRYRFWASWARDTVP